MGALACGNDPPAADTDGSTGDPATSASPTSNTPSTSTTQPPTDTETTGDETTTGGSDSTSLDTGDPTGNDSTTTGTPGECVDEDIGMSIGEDVASGHTANAGNEWDVNSCYGGGESSSGFDDWGSGFVSFVGSDVDSGGSFIIPPDTEGGFVSSGGWDTEFGSSFVTGFGDSSGGWASSGSGGGFDGDDYVIEWTPPGSGPYVLSLQGSAFDTLLLVSPPMCGADWLACNDQCFGNDSALVFDATEGETVYIIVTGYYGQTGSFVLSIYEGDNLDCFGGGGTDSDTATSGSFTESASTTDFSTSFAFIVDPTTSG